MRDLTIQLVENCTDNILQNAVAPWEQVLEILKTCTPHGSLSLEDYLKSDSKTRHSQKDNGGWIPCSVKDQEGRRIQGNMDMAHLLVLDIDDGLSLEDIRKRVGRYEYAVHSTYSHSEEKPKWRVVLPLLKPIPATKLSALFDQVNQMFDNKLDASCGHDPARMYYLPGCPPDAEKLFTFEHNSGEWLDADSMIAEKMESGEVFSGGASEASPKLSKVISFEVGYPDGQRTRELTRRVGHCVATGMSEEETTLRCLQWNEFNTPPLDKAKVISVVKSICKIHAEKESVLENDSARLIGEMNQKYAWIERHGLVYRYKYRDLVKIDKLRQQMANTHIKAKIRGTYKDMTHADAWHVSPDRKKFDDLVFLPGKPAVHENCINLWRGWGVEPSEGDIGPWNELLNHLFNGDAEMRHWFECWAAYPIQHPGVKLNSAVVFWSALQGVGKTLIGETIGRIYGENFKTISAVELHSRFNGWARDCQFVLGEENSSADHRADSNKLKHLITGNTIFVEEKFQPSMEMPNRVNFIFTSNHPDAFYLEAHDRRFFVWSITAPKLSSEFYAGFVQWRDNGGTAALMHHFMQMELSEFDPKASPPLTDSKREMIEISRSDLERWISDAFDSDAAIEDVFGKQVATIDDVIKRYHCEHPHSRCNTTSMSRALRRNHRYAQCRVMTHAGRKSLISLTQHDDWASRDGRAWAEEYKKPMPMIL